jgi:hypothetical protein
MGDMKTNPGVRLLVENSFKWNVVKGDHSAALIVLDPVKTTLRVSFGNFRDCGLNFGRHQEMSSRVVVVGDCVKAAFVREVDLFAVGNGLVRLMVTKQVEQKIQLDFDILRLRRFLDFKTGVVVAMHVNLLFVDVKLDTFRVGVRMMVMMLGMAVGELLSLFHLVLLDCEVG